VPRSKDQRDEKCDQQHQQRAGLADGMRELGQLPAERVPQAAEQQRPAGPTGRVVDGEPAVGHPGDASQQRGEHAEQGDEAAEEDRLATMSPEELLGALWLFGSIAEDIIHHDPLVQFDLTIANVIYRHATPMGVAVARGVSLLGSPGFIAAWGLVVVGLLLVRRRDLLLGGWVAALAGGGLLDFALKRVFHRTRPTWDVPLLTALGWSFPSGHAMGSLVAYGMLAYLLVRQTHRRRQQLGIIACATLLIVLIGLSRMCLGIHYFSDVIGGYAAGVVWLAACISGLEVVRRRPRGSSPGHRLPHM
jgi:membrane-associated phospholipid phosphatase